MSKQRRVLFEKGSNHRAQGKGVYGMEIRFVLTGRRGSVVFCLGTGWVPGEPMPERLAGLYPTGQFIGLHAEHPWTYEGASGTADFCIYNRSGDCIYDASFTAAVDAMRVLIDEGEEALWQHLETWYDRLPKRGTK